ncbi:hypothetical protein Moror_16851 [Moniliophthora roreri MCA 2997]|uniref:Zn(2)-C6 fungal-type domain-containing protein n=1 Tax=Moniliophthora roreri (strain MCA 2997) TaxID=1381753 RepID=V2XBA0_MONRO|nr:hypothetical protein Moror_16851 [Moniliophthora roreri MCA 2997]
MSSDTGKSKRRRERNIFKQPDGLKHLRRGKACLNCRFLKIKCDGVKPTCGPCIRVPKDDPCEFTDGPSRTVMLQENIARLQARVRELEEGDSARYSSSHPSTPSSSSGADTVSNTNSPAPPPYQSYPHFEGGFLINFSVDPLRVDAKTLVEEFLPHGPQFGFFLNADRFRQSVLGQSLITAPASVKTVLSAVCLFAVHLSQDDESREAEFLRQALYGLPLEMGNSFEPPRIMDIIQARVLLASYFLRKNQFFESDYHINNAVSLCVAYGLHKISLLYPDPHKLLAVVDGKEIFSVPPKDSIEMGERISGFWTVFSMQRQMLVSRYPSSCAFGNLDSVDEVTTPWPLKMEDYASIPLSSMAGQLSNLSLDNHVGTPRSSSELAMYTKATIILHRASYLSSKLETNQLSMDSMTIFDEYMKLADLITQFQLALKPLVPDIQSGSRTLAIIHSIIACAYINTQQIGTMCSLGEAAPACADAALSVLQTYYTISTSQGAPVPLNPFSSTLCSMAAKYLLQERARIRSLCAGIAWPNMETSGSADFASQQTRLDAAVEEGKSIVMFLSTVCPSMSYSCEKLCQLHQQML